jgi:hypothetical protein
MEEEEEEEEEFIYTKVTHSCPLPPQLELQVIISIVFT